MDSVAPPASCRGLVIYPAIPPLSLFSPLRDSAHSYVSEWPVWVTKHADGSGDGSDSKVPVARVQMPEEQAVDPLSTWVPPSAFEQLWLPADLPTPRARAAVGFVLRDGDPRFIFPTVDAFLETSDGTRWRNRGLNSVPIAKTWLHFGEVPPEELRLSAYFAPAEPTREESAEPSESSDGGGSRVGAYERILDSTRVDAAVDAAFDALDALPPQLRKRSLGSGFAFLIVPLEGGDAAVAATAAVQQQQQQQPAEGTTGGLYLPSHALAPGGRLRAFLSEDGKDADSDAWQRGELDLTMWRLPPGKDSPYMQKQYKPLYGEKWF